jgi:hypothetical protein
VCNSCCLQDGQQQLDDCEASFVVLLLVHAAGCPNADIWTEWLAKHQHTSSQPRRVEVFAHIKVRSLDMAKWHECVS